MSDPDIKLRLPATAENVAVVRHGLGGLVDAVDLDEDVIADMGLAVSEACANVVVHAYDGDEPGLLEVWVAIDEAEIRVVVRDCGGGIAPHPESVGAGIGLPLIASACAALELRTGSDGQNEVWMCFPRDSDASLESA